MANSAFSANFVQSRLAPQGRLTLVTGTPVLTSDQGSIQNVFYTPYVGDLIPIYNGSSWELKQFSELTLAMAGSSNWAANANFDLFVINDAGTLRLATGTAWTSDTARSSDTITRVNGIWLNSTTHTMRYGASSTVSVPAQRATYVGTMRCGGATGICTMLFGSRAASNQYIVFDLWNAYNRVLHRGVCSDTTDSWTYSTATWRSVQTTINNACFFTRGLDEDAMEAIYQVTTDVTQGRAGGGGIGLDSTSGLHTKSSYVTHYSNIVLSAGDQSFSSYASRGIGMGRYTGLPGIGRHAFYALEYASGATVTFFGDAGTSDNLMGLHVVGMF